MIFFSPFSVFNIRISFLKLPYMKHMKGFVVTFSYTYTMCFDHIHPSSTLSCPTHSSLNFSNLAFSCGGGEGQGGQRTTSESQFSPSSIRTVRVVRVGSQCLGWPPSLILANE